MPTSFIASTTNGLTSLFVGIVLALVARSPNFLANPSAIWLLPAFSTHTERIVGLIFSYSTSFIYFSSIWSASMVDAFLNVLVKSAPDYLDWNGWVLPSADKNCSHIWYWIIFVERNGGQKAKCIVELWRAAQKKSPDRGAEVRPKVGCRMENLGRTLSSIWNFWKQHDRSSISRATVLRLFCLPAELAFSDD